MTSSARRTRSVALVVAALVVLLAVGIGYRLYRKATAAVQPCTIGERLAECRRVYVAENPAEPNGKKIALNVAVFRATGAKPKPDPLFWFAGWGSAGVTDDAANVISAFRRVNADRDVVFIDQRGTGSSQLVCPLPPVERLAAVAAEAVTAAVRRCAQRAGPNLRYYTSAIAVDDFDAVRKALGYRTINIYGGSYGATTGQIYLLRHGAHVRSAALDGGSLLDVRIFERGARNAQRALNMLFKHCAADTLCATAYPHLREEFRTTQARLARSPVRVPGSKLVLDDAGFASAVEDAIAFTGGKPSAPQLIHLIATGQLAHAAKLAEAVSGPEKPELTYKLLIECSEPWASWRPHEIDRVAAGTFMARFHQLNARFVEAGCKALPHGVAPAAIGQRVKSSAPVLFLTGNEDPADPPASVVNARRELPNSRTVIFPAAGHGQLGFLCAQNLIADFVASGSADGLDTSCAGTAARVQFITDP